MGREVYASLVAETFGHGTICNCVKRFFYYIQMHLGSLPACQVDGGIENSGLYAFSNLDVSVRFISRQSGTNLPK